MSDRVLSRKDGIGDGRSLSVSDRSLYSYPVHTHDYCEIELVTSGSGTQLLGNEKNHLTRGSVSILTPADCHSVESEVGLTIKNISFAEELIPEHLRGRLYRLASYTGRLDEGDIDRLCRISELLSLEQKTSERISFLLEYLLSLFPDTERTRQIDPVDAARLYADTHFREALSVADGARVACLSPVYFGALFKKRMGISFGAYLNKRKLAFARTLLEGGVNVTDACFESGFGSVSNFAKAFRAEYGRSPGSLGPV